MENKLRAYMDHLFQDVPNTKKAVEVKEEILQNIVDKYHDLVAEGKSEEAAYNIAIASIGDLDELLASLKDSSQTPNQIDSENYMAWRKKSAIRISVAIMLYILCVTRKWTTLLWKISRSGRVKMTRISRQCVQLKVLCGYSLPPCTL